MNNIRNQKIREVIREGADSSDLGFYCIVLPSLLLPIAYFHIISLKHRSRLSLLRERWGSPRESGTEIENLSFYHNARRSAQPTKHLDEQTWDDLNLTEVFRQLDHTNSAIGQQVLYHILKTPHDGEHELTNRDRLAKCFADQSGLRESLQLALCTLNTRNAYDLPRLFLQSLPILPRFYAALPACALLAIAALSVLPLATGMEIIALLAILVFNIVVGLSFRRRFQDFGIPIRSMHSLITVGERISWINSPQLADQTKRLRIHCKRLQPLKRISKYLVFDNHFNEILASLYAYLNTFLLIDLNVYLASIKMLEKRKEDVRVIYEILGNIDATISVASFRYSLPSYCTPRFTSPSSEILAEGVWHPLLPESVENSIAIKDSSILLYGANMSGKTTFLRSLGLSAILGQTIYTCLARSYQAPFVNVKSFINRKDDILGGKSYFLEEVESVKELICARDSTEQHLFLLDELFKGTSPQECTAISHAVLRYFDSSKHVTVVATHDASLQNLMSGWDIFHLGEVLRDGRRSFDYKVYKGMGGSNSALALLEANGYPEEVVQTARRFLASSGDGNFG